MKFGLLFELEPGPKPWAPGREHQVFHEARDQAVLAEELGWDYIWAVEHHFLTGYSSSSAPEVFLGWLAGQTDRIRLGHGVVHASPEINHFWRIAERAAALDLICDGRLELGTGRGFSPSELAAFRVDPATTRPAQLEVVRMLQSVYLEETFSWKGRFYDLSEQEIAPKPLQQPHPPVWMACTQPATWEMAADMGAGVLAFGEKEPEVVKEKIALYRERVVKAKTPSGQINNHVAFAPNLFCAETDKEALETCADHLLYFVGKGLEYIKGWRDTTAKDYQYYAEIGQRQLDLTPLPASETVGLSEPAATVKAASAHGICCVGSPDTCRDFVRRYADVGLDQMIFVAQMGTLTNDQIQSSMRLISEEVLGEFSDGITVSQVPGAA